MLLSCIQAFWIRVSVRKIVDVQNGHMSGRGTCLFWGDWHKSIAQKARSCFVFVDLDKCLIDYHRKWFSML